MFMQVISVPAQKKSVICTDSTRAQPACSVLTGRGLSYGGSTAEQTTGYSCCVSDRGDVKVQWQGISQARPWLYPVR